MEETILNYIELGLTKLDILSIASGIFSRVHKKFVNGASIIIVLVLSFILGPHEVVSIAALSAYHLCYSSY